MSLPPSSPPPSPPPSPPSSPLDSPRPPSPQALYDNSVYSFKNDPNSNWEIFDDKQRKIEDLKGLVIVLLRLVALGNAFMVDGGRVIAADTNKIMLKSMVSAGRRGCYELHTTVINFSDSTKWTIFYPRGSFPEPGGDAAIAPSPSSGSGDVPMHGLQFPSITTRRSD